MTLREGDGGTDSTGGALGADFLAALEEELAGADALLARYRGDDWSRRPVQTIYLPAPGFDATWLARAREAAQRALTDTIGSADALAGLLGEEAAVGLDAEKLWQQVVAKLAAEPVEDLRIDLEDGYGTRLDTAEDADATRAGRELAAALKAGAAPPWVGLRFKSMEPPTRARGLRSLDLFLDAVLADAPLPDGFVLTLPKVTSAGQVAAMNLVCAWLESHHGLPAGRLGFEVQVETAQAIMAPDGAAEVARIVHAGEGRVTGLHYGTYDYGAALGVSAAEQRMDHPVADYATSVMQVAAAQTGVRISHGSTNVLPVGERDAALAAWALHARLVRRHLTRGIYQGWDLHPHQLVTRYAATFAFFRSGLDEVFDRLSAYLDSTEAAAEATDDAPAVLDEPASAVALGGFLLRGLQCGAVAADEVLAGTGLAADGLEALARRQRPQRAGRPTPGDTP